METKEELECPHLVKELPFELVVKKYITDLSEVPIEEEVTET